jgi:ADP-dependent NAD(P)H-hydrate dehydratase / NAD(P)H-hydrate epimerase
MRGCEAVGAAGDYGNYNARMNPRPGAIYTAAQVRELDRRAINDCGIAGYELMTRAGHALADAVRGQWPDARSITVLAGPGNNAGDGYVCARIARARRIEAQVLAIAPPASLKGDARRACEEFHAAGGRTLAFAPTAIEGEVIVDAIFGIGITRPASGHYAAAINAANASGRRILAVDLPSGLDADNGRPHGDVIRADATLSFIGRKLGCYLGAGPDYAGLRLYSDLNVPPAAYENVPAAAQLIGPDIVRAALPPRPRTAHKGHHGHVLVIGGAPGLAGAARLAGEAALRAGAGLVSIVTHRASAAAIAGRAELMVASVDTAAELAPLLERASIVAVGPGLGQQDWSRAMLSAALASGLPAVIDADALNLLAGETRRREDWVLTPHPGEAARLLGTAAASVQDDRLGAARELQRRYGGTVVLKGAGTIVQAANTQPSICDLGNPGMAVAGMGDVLTGVIAGIAAQCRDLPLAAAAGVFVHAAAGDRAARGGQRGLLAGDLIDELRGCVNPA